MPRIHDKKEKLLADRDIFHTSVIYLSPKFIENDGSSPVTSGKFARCPTRLRRTSPSRRKETKREEYYSDGINVGT